MCELNKNSGNRSGISCNSNSNARSSSTRELHPPLHRSLTKAHAHAALARCAARDGRWVTPQQLTHQAFIRRLPAHQPQNNPKQGHMPCQYFGKSLCQLSVTGSHTKAWDGVMRRNTVHLKRSIARSSSSLTSSRLNRPPWTTSTLPEHKL